MKLASLTPRRLWNSIHVRAGRWAPGINAFQIRVPIAQVFLGGANRTSTYTLVNFPSLYSPKTAVPCRYHLSLFGPGGEALGSKTVTVPVFGSVEVKAEELFGRALPEFGMFAARIDTGRGLRNPYPHLRTLYSHFYALYGDSESRCSALIHPQTAFDVRAQPHERGRSNLLIETERLSAIEVYQINPSQDSVKSTLNLWGEDERLIASAEATLAPHGARRVLWGRAVTLRHRRVFVSIHGLTAPNAKPLIFQVFHDGSFSACHS